MVELSGKQPSVYQDSRSSSQCCTTIQYKETHMIGHVTRRTHHGMIMAPPDGNVQMILRGEGVNGSQSFVDGSTYNRTLTFSGSPTISTDFPLNGSSSLKFVAGSCVKCGTLPTLGADFCIEAWVRPTSLSVYGIVITTYNLGTTQTLPYIISVNTSKGTSISDGYTKSVATGANLVPLNTWTHLAFTHTNSNSSNTIWVNGVGVASGSVTFTHGTTVFIGGSPGDNNAGSNWFVGYMRDIRVTTGTVRYNQNFTPPTFI
jgi:hypothetical protein